MVDVTGIEAEEFDEVTLLGRDGAEEITVDELARGVVSGDGWIAWQNVWKAEPWKSAAEPFAEAPVLVTPDGVELKFSSSGAVTAKLGTAIRSSSTSRPRRTGSRVMRWRSNSSGTARRSRRPVRSLPTESGLCYNIQP